MCIHKFLLFALLVIPAAAQDAAVVNPKIVKVEFENNRVRILRAVYDPQDVWTCTPILQKLRYKSKRAPCVSSHLMESGGTTPARLDSSFGSNP
jgi:hypothetical protein